MHAWTLRQSPGVQGAMTMRASSARSPSSLSHSPRGEAQPIQRGATLVIGISMRTLVVCALLAAAGPIPAPVFAQAVTYTTYTLPYTYGIYPRGVAVNPSTRRIYDTYTWVDESFYFGQGNEIGRAHV